MIEEEHLKKTFSSEEFDRFLDALDNETDRGLVLAVSCMLELSLERCLEAWLSKGPTKASKSLRRADGPLGSFSSRIDLLCCLGGVDEYEYKALHLVRRIRNSFAHELLSEFDSPELSDRSKELCRHVLAEIEPETLEKLIAQGPRRCFVAASFILVDMLKLRPVLVSSMAQTIRHDFASMNREVEQIVERSG